MEKKLRRVISKGEVINNLKDIYNEWKEAIEDEPEGLDIDYIIADVLGALELDDLKTFEAIFGADAQRIYEESLGDEE
jgi:hypothetical protein